MQVQLGWEAKRDMWNGYDPSNYKEVIKEYEIRESVRNEKKNE